MKKLDVNKVLIRANQIYRQRKEEKGVAQLCHNAIQSDQVIALAKALVDEINKNQES